MSEPEAVDAWRRDLLHWARSAGTDVVLFDRVPSTHLVGREVATLRPLPVAWITAWEQTAGRGRGDRAWSSPAGRGVYATRVTVAPTVMLGRAAMATGVALCGALRDLGVDGRLDWPNDIVVDGRKLGGILIDARTDGDRTALVVSFGVNRAHEDVDLPRPDATSLAREGLRPLPELAPLTARLAAAVDDLLQDGDPAAIHRRFRRWSLQQPGDWMELREGDRTVAGEMIAFTDDGHLELATERGRVRVTGRRRPEPLGES